MIFRDQFQIIGCQFRVRIPNLGKEFSPHLFHFLSAGPFGGIYGQKDEQACGDVLHKAIEVGMNYIDTAPWYGQGLV